MCQQTARKYKTSLITVVLFAMSLSVAASEYMPLRFEENWGSNCNKITPKCWRITEETTLTLGSDARVRAQGYWPLDFGIGNTMNSHRGDSYTLFRGLMHGDLRVGKHAQMFMQFGAYDESGRRGGAESTDQSNIDLQQGFLAWNGDRFSLRAGRQEVILGTSRLIAVREGSQYPSCFRWRTRQLETGAISH